MLIDNIKYKVYNVENKFKHYYLLFYLLFKKQFLLNISIIFLIGLYSYIYSNNLYIYVIIIILINTLYNLNKSNYDELIGLTIYPNNILIYTKKINLPIEYDFVLNHEIKHLIQFKNKNTNFENLKILEKDADSYSLSILSKKYPKNEITTYILNNKLFFH